MNPLACPHCGAANRSGSNFCNRCGADLRGESTLRPAEGGGQSGGRPAPQGQPPSAAPLPPDQPWLRPGFVGEDDVPLEPEEPDILLDVDDGVDDATDIPVAPGRLVSGVQGLLEPIRVATMPGEGGQSLPGMASVSTGLVLDAEHLRRVRGLMAEEPVLAAAQPSPVRYTGSLWLPWVFLAIGLAVALPVFWQLNRPVGVARQWPGVAAAFDTIDHLQATDSVQILWAYDPATAGELDLVAAPVMRHLLAQGVTTTIVSLLPNGPATARRLITQVQAEPRRLRGAFAERAPVEPRFLPGGVMVLPSLGQEPAALAVVFAAQAEDVQAWLEQVAPRNQAPVVAATGAGADPLLRPYLDSGQLVGLVSGFDGAASYTTLLREPPTIEREQQVQRQLVGQNIALLAFLALIVAGNLAALVGGRRGNG